jgi:hypothetical protein
VKELRETILEDKLGKAQSKTVKADYEGPGGNYYYRFHLLLFGLLKFDICLKQCCTGLEMSSMSQSTLLMAHLYVAAKNLRPELPTRVDMELFIRNQALGTPLRRQASSNAITMFRKVLACNRRVTPRPREASTDA